MNDNSIFRVIGKRVLLVSLLFAAAGADAAVLPAPPVPVTLPNHAPNAFGVSVAFGPADGLMYVWNGGSVLRQDAVNSPGFTSIGNVGSGSADAGPIAFSQSGAQLLVGNGAGGILGGSHAGLLFSIPASGGDSNTSVGSVPFQDNLKAAPFGGSDNKFFVNQGNASFTGSSVSVFDRLTGGNVSVIHDIPGASGSMAISGGGRLFVGIGFGPHRGELRSFALADLENAYNTATPLDWSSGQVFNAVDNNSAAGLFFDARGYLFAGGPSGVTVFDTQGHSRLYDNQGYTSVVYDALDDRMLVTGFGNEQGIYPASTFIVPEPNAAVLLVLGGLLALFWRGRRAGRVSGVIAGGLCCLVPSTSAVARPFAPAAGQPGSTAVANTSPAIVEWAVGFQNLVRGPQDIANPGLGLASLGTGAEALGPADGNPSHVVSLGDGGQITLTFAQPIVDGPGFDFAVFENSFSDTFLELALVEVSSNGVDFARFAAVSLTSTAAQVGSFGSIDPTDLDNLAGKYRGGFGTPFDLSQLAGLSPNVDVNHVIQVRIVDVVGSINPALGTLDSLGNLVNDPYPTAFASSGFDLDGVGVMHSVPEPASRRLLLVGVILAVIALRRFASLRGPAAPLVTGPV